MTVGEIKHDNIRYTLADGTEVLRSLDQSNERLDGYERTWVNHPTLGAILVRNDKLTKVEPPSPSEPAEGFAGRDSKGRVWTRDDDAERAGTIEPDHRWWRGSIGYTWGEVCASAGPDGLVELLPDRHGVMAAARAWRARITSPPNHWADDEDFALIAAVDAETAERAAAEQEASKP